MWARPGKGELAGLHQLEAPNVYRDTGSQIKRNQQHTEKLRQQKLKYNPRQSQVEHQTQLKEALKNKEALCQWR